jgi:hypothetical protein
VLATAGDGLGQRGIVAGQQRGTFGLQPLEEQRVTDGAVLDYLGQPGAQLAHRQAAQGGGVGDDRARRVEGADQVLALRDVHGGLATDRGVHHRQQRGGQLHAVHAPHPARRGEAGQVADHATAQCQHAGIAGGAQRRQRGDRTGEVVQGLGRLAGRDHVLADLQLGAGRLQGIADACQVQRGHGVVAGQQHVASADGRAQQAGVGQQPGADVDLVREFAANGDGTGGSGHAVGSEICHWLASRTTSWAVASAEV